jgi:Spy/CpxP family protein refolding chaperone
MDERPRRLRTRRAWLGALVLAALALGAAGVAAAPGWLGHARHGFAHLRGHHAWSEADIRFAVAFWLRDTGASEEQTERIAAIASAAHADLHALHDAHHARRGALVAALVAADRAALEQLRRETLAAAEGASQRLVSGLADAAEVLTPEQRRALAEAHAAHHGG